MVFILRKDHFTKKTGFLSISCGVSFSLVPTLHGLGRDDLVAKSLSFQAGEGRVGITDTVAIPTADGLNAVNDHNFTLGFIFMEKIK